MRVQIPPVDAVGLGDPGQTTQHVNPITQLHDDNRTRQIVKGETGLQILDNDYSANREIEFSQLFPGCRYIVQTANPLPQALVQNAQTDELWWCLETATPVKITLA